mmetsp:Transcript_14314/g.18561  ORF Transcript_14314/g.18561 Transcript_14314/m.18561 type:complete len:877 (+) Transcript_14314:211-2841(+)|eukprot:CAMPEP_0204835484 /NCGR_PEP_ID=MMETSP1346-20131115/22714_1 /ASSEMBLY_ACC=CAM_ASM_000771 /TAXON_ID=215587 /ORGANISM="Aplanochytrium stocchinoi, Strain GSBS06" /LENGTH=876 /DNA_ID=CAMNT_0051969537 /DNA_START=156 /DNA_END=2786 /DNA_ORIENTATION=-
MRNYLSDGAADGTENGIRNNSKKNHTTSSRRTSRRLPIRITVPVLFSFSQLWDGFCCQSRSRGGTKNVGGNINRKKRYMTLDERIQEEWKKADVDEDGSLNITEMRSMLQRLNISIPVSRISTWMLKPYDTDGNGLLDFNEFRVMFKSIHSIPDLRQQFLVAKYKYKYLNDSHSLPLYRYQVDVLMLNPTDLVWFFEYASNGHDKKSEEDCKRLIKQYMISNYNDSNGNATELKDKDGVNGVTERIGAPQDLDLLQESESKTEPEYLMSYEGFVLMMSNPADNDIGDPKYLKHIFQEMCKPLSHYFISSSHNSYLLGNQLVSSSSPDAIKNALLRGVRVIELDSYNGSNGRPNVTHGNTACGTITFEQCILAIEKYAFETTEYPCIITIENHCSREQQKVQVEIMEAILGEDMLRWDGVPNINADVEAMSENSLREFGMQEWMSPEDLKRKYIIRDKVYKRVTKDDRRKRAQKLKEIKNEESEDKSSVDDGLSGGTTTTNTMVQTPEEPKSPNEASTTRDNRNGSTDSDDTSDDNNDTDDNDSAEKPNKNNLHGVCKELLRLIYIKNVSLPLHITNENNRGGPERVEFHEPPYVCSSSINEDKMLKITKSGNSIAATNSYSIRHLIRVYPSGKRVDSSNYDPIPAWNSGCQIVALNYQTFSMPVWLNHGKFLYNGGCGYVLKPSAMTSAVRIGMRKKASADGGLEFKDNNNSSDVPHRNVFKKKFGDSFKGIVPELGHLPWDPYDLNRFQEQRRVFSITIISGHYLLKTNKSVSRPLVQVALHGISADCKSFETKQAKQGFKASWSESFTFTTHFTELALLSFVVRNESSTGAVAGQKVIPLDAVRPGYRVIPLLSEDCTPLDHSFLFCHFQWLSK